MKLEQPPDLFDICQNTGDLFGFWFNKHLNKKQVLMYSEELTLT